MCLIIRVLLVDDSPDFLKSAGRFLSLQPSLQVVGSATSGKEALKQIPQLAPHLVLLDWAMPEMSGLEALRRIKARESPPRVVMLTLYDIVQYRRAAQLAGADGFLCKTEWSAQLMPLVHCLFPVPNLPSSEGQEKQS